MTPQYRNINDEIVDRLVAIVTKRNVIYRDAEKLEPYSHDEVVEKEYQRLPDVVVKPENAEQIAAILKLANRENIPVTPRGAGSGLSGGAVPIHGGIVLSLEKMNQVLEIDTENMVAVVEPGVVTNDLNEKLKDYQLFFAGYPMSMESCFIGGNVAENAGGGRAVKYGVTGRYILGLELVTPTGEILHLGGKNVKDVVGYDLVQLMVGSEGTLGIFTKIYVKLLPLPPQKVVLLAPFRDVETAIHLVPRIITSGGIIPTAVEFMDREAAQLASNFLNEKLFADETGALLLIEIDGSDAEQLAIDYEIIGELCLENAALEVYVADNYTTQKRVWDLRKNIPESIQAYSPVKSSEDLVVPISKIPELVKAVQQIAAEHEVKIACFGHAGDGNIHTTIIKRPEMEMARWRSTVDAVEAALFTKTIALGGTISGEHGIGHKRKRYMSMALDAAAIDMMKRVKLAFDPKYILNPGKMFDAEPVGE